MIGDARVVKYGGAKARDRGLSWREVDLTSAPATEPVAYGGGLSGPELLEAYRAGVFPMPADGAVGALINRTLHTADTASGRIALLPGRADPYDLAWHCPDPMPVIGVPDVHLSHSMRRLLRNRYRGWRTTANQRFTEVMARCAGSRKPVWITEELTGGMIALHQAGWAHSIEVWDGETMIGGLFGVATGAVFSADSMFHTASNASKVAVADLADRLSPTPVQLIAVQVLSPHVVAAGASPMDRVRYLSILAQLANPVALDPSSQPAARLATAGQEGS
ncbi:MAG: leucyl/phenylalanyl-tRNA--protein transferase [Egibacteraceae bacterium]